MTKIEALKTLVDYHEDLREICNAVLKYTSDEGNPDNVIYQTLVTYLNSEFKPHLALEEDVVFPAVDIFTRTNKMKNLTMKYIQEHCDLLQQIYELMHKIATKATDKISDRDQWVKEEFTKIVENLLNHAKNEDCRSYSEQRIDRLWEENT